MFLYSLILCNILIFYAVGPTDLLSEVSTFRHGTQLSSKFSISLFSSLNLCPLAYVSDSVPLCNSRINFLVDF